MVQTLERKGEKEAREREEMLRKVVKGVVHCDVLAEPPIEKGFEGPYDVLIEGGACTSFESFKKALVSLTQLLRPGGNIIMWDTFFSGMEQCTTVYSMGDKEYNCLCTEKEFVIDAVKEAGLTIEHMHNIEYDRSKNKQAHCVSTRITGLLLPTCQKEHFLIIVDGLYIWLLAFQLIVQCNWCGKYCG